MAFALTQADRDALQDMLAWYRKFRPRVPLRNFVVEDFTQTPEVYVALTPSGGIPALEATYGTSGPSSGDVPGSATCDVYRVLHGSLGTGDYAELPQLEAADLQQIVYNLSSTAVNGTSWVLVIRDKFGKWWANVGGGSVTYTGLATVKYFDNSLVLDNIGSIELDKTDGYVLSQPGVGRAKLKLADASETQRGIVGLDNQVVGAGIKLFLETTRHVEGWVSCPQTFDDLDTGYRYLEGKMTLIPSTAEDANVFRFRSVQFEDIPRHAYVYEPQDDVGDINFSDTIGFELLLGSVVASGYRVFATPDCMYSEILGGQTVTFTTVDGKTITATGGIITEVVT